jgi:putative transposase
MREVIDAILYVVKTDCQWRQLPDDFGPWMSVYSHFRRMRLNGTWEKIERALQQKIRKGL